MSKEIPQKIQDESKCSFKALNRKVNEIIACLPSFRIGESPSVKRKIGSLCTTLNVNIPTVESSAGVQRLEIVSISRFYLGCRIPDDDSTELIYVAKQANAVGDTTDSNKKTISLTGPTVDLIQDLTPPYIAGGTIFAAMDVTNKTDVTRSVTTTNADGTATTVDVDVENLEISPSREWVDPLQTFCVLVGGVKKVAHVRSSPAA